MTTIGRNDIAVFAPHVNVAQNIIRDAPDKIGDPVEIISCHVNYTENGNRPLVDLVPLIPLAMQIDAHRNLQRLLGNA